MTEKLLTLNKILINGFTVKIDDKYRQSQTKKYKFYLAVHL